MPRSRIPLNLSVPSQEDKEMIRRKAKQRRKPVSEIVLAHFKRLPDLSPSQK